MQWKMLWQAFQTNVIVISKQI